MKKLFVSHCDADIKVRMASKSESITPSNFRQHKIIDALSKSDTLLALMTINALAKPMFPPTERLVSVPENAFPPVYISQV